MNILIDAHVFDGKFQGTRTYLEGLYTYMTCHKDINFFFASNRESELVNVFGIAPNIHYLHLEDKGRIYRLAIDFPRLIKKYKIDYAHFQYISPLVKKCKEIVTIHDLLFMDFPQYFPRLYKLKNKLLFKRSAQRADLLLTVSEFSKSEIVRHFGVNDNDVYITYNSILEKPSISGVDIKKIYNLDKYLLTVSRIEPRKNHLSLLKAFVNIKLYNKDYKLVMVGSKDLQYKEFFDYYESLDEFIKKKVSFVQAPFEHLVALYQQASLFVFPSFAEGFGIPPIEALAYGCPILCSKDTAMKEFDLPSEITFDPHCQDELESKIIQQLNSSYDLNSVRSKIKNKYNWEDIANNYYSLLKSNFSKNVKDAK